MKPWAERPFEIRNLFNPAFCGLILVRAIHSFEEERGEGLPFSLSILILPLSLHKESRQIITRHPRGYILKTLSDNPQMLVRFPERTRSLLPHSFEAMGLLLQHQAIKISPLGSLHSVERAVRKKIDGTNESIECQQAARIIGRQFARINDRITIYASLRIRP